MGKNNRRRQIENARSGPLYVLAGLPPRICNAARQQIEKLGPSGTQVIALPARADNSPALYRDAYVGQIVRAVAGFAVRKRVRAQIRPAAPASLVLLYVEAPDQERLLSAFDFAAYSHPLKGLSEYIHNKGQKRHDDTAVEWVLYSFFDSKEPHLARFASVRRRIQAIRDQEALLLPPNNFRLAAGYISMLFRKIRSGQIAWEDVAKDLTLEEYRKEHFAVIKSGHTRRAFRDDGDVVFLCANPGAYHGGAWEIEHADDISALRGVLRTLYRFGTPLPDGFHHDAQHLGGQFKDYRLNCCVAGEQVVSGPYANIYPDDYVRMGT